MKLSAQCFASVVAISIVAAGPVRAFAAEKDIVDTAVAAGSFKTLATALQAAGLVDALKGDGPFTVFAPSDDAFAKLPEGTVSSLIDPKNKAKLTSILTYHVVVGLVPASDVVSLNHAQTLNGQRVEIRVEAGNVAIDNAKVTATDIKCSNGIIHVIDRVLLPSSKDIPTTAVEAGSFQTLVAAVKAAGLLEALAGEGPLTVFAPTDDAFAKLPAGTVESLLKAENRDKLADILKYHVVPGRVFSDAALAAGRASTLQGGSVKIAFRNGAGYVNDAKLVATDIDASNGVIHVIDSVLLPPAQAAAAQDPRRVMEDAVAVGARLYNAGHAAGCARTYKQALMTMLNTEDHGMPALAVRAMRTALHRAEKTHCTDTQSWILRHGINTAYRAMSPTPASTVSSH